jgi:prepilin-type N-terminal cleavage/methylation domain-containing protein
MKENIFCKGVSCRQFLIYGILKEAMNMRAHNTHGFTLFETLITMSIVAFLLTASIINWRGQLQHAIDAERKGDLNRLKAVLEQYSNDHGCYPQVNQMICTSTIFSSYNMPKVICDPESKQPYLYEAVNPANLCLGYRLYTILKNKTDLDITRVGCNRTQGCGVIEHPEYNYGVSSGGSIVQ